MNHEKDERDEMGGLDVVRSFVCFVCFVVRIFNHGSLGSDGWVQSEVLWSEPREFFEQEESKETKEFIDCSFVEEDAMLELWPGWGEPRKGRKRRNGFD
jgi:hypothetical protein